MPTLAQMMKNPLSRATAARAPRPTGQALMREHLAQTRRPMPIVLTGTHQERRQAEAKAKALLQNPAVRKQLREADIALPPLATTAAPAVARTSAVLVFTPQEAMASLRGMAREIRHRQPGTEARAFAVACDARQDLALAAGLAGAGVASYEAAYDAWINGSGYGHAEDCRCGLTGCHPGRAS